MDKYLTNAFKNSYFQVFKKIQFKINNKLFILMYNKKVIKYDKNKYTYIYVLKIKDSIILILYLFGLFMNRWHTKKDKLFRFYLIGV